MKIKPFIFNKMKENSFVVWEETDGAALIIDPGAASSGERAELDAFLKDSGLRPQAILVTHPHFDHIAGAASICREYGLECHICEADRSLGDRQDEVARLYDFHYSGEEAPVRYFSQGHQTLRFGSIAVEVLPIGGHTPGSVAFYIAGAKAVFAGDTLVKGSLGFLETGFKDTLENIRDYLLPLPDDTRIFPGHGEFSTIGEEKRENRFFRRSAGL